MSKHSTKSKSTPSSGVTGNGGGMSGASATGDERRTGMMSGAANLAHEAADTVRDAASASASSVKRQVTQVLDKQVASGADLIRQVARSTRHAADDLERDIPQVAGVIRAVADRADTYANDLTTKSLDDIIRSASEFTRRQPAVVFGAAAMAGFLILRMMKAGSEQREGGHGMAPRSSTGDMGHRQGSAGTMGGSGDHVS